jgi:hypothetical protein
MTPEHFAKIGDAMKEHARTLEVRGVAEAHWRAAYVAVSEAEDALAKAKGRLIETLDIAGQADRDATAAEHRLNRATWEAFEEIRNHVAVNSCMVPDWTILPLTADDACRAMQRDAVRDRLKL